MSQQPPPGWQPRPGNMPPSEPTGNYPPYGQPPPGHGPPQWQQPPPGYTHQSYVRPPTPPVTPHKKKLPTIVSVGLIVLGGFFVFILGIAIGSATSSSKAIPTQGVLSASTGVNTSATTTRSVELSQIAALTVPTSASVATRPVGSATSVAAAPITVTPTIAPTATTAPTATPAPVALKLVSSGFGQNSREIGVGFVVENPDTARPISLSQYQVAAFDASGTVLTTESNYIELILPGQRLGVGVTMYLTADTKVAKVDVQLKPGKPTDAKTPPALTTDKATFKPDKNYPKASGIVKSTYGQDLKNIRASVVLYDDSGKIIGGGFTYVDFIPANGQAAVDMSVTYSGTPTKIELYAALSGLSTL